MNISEILGKVVNGEEVSAAEKDRLRLELDNVERMGKLVNSWVVPGSSVPYIRDLKTSNVRIDSGEIQLGSGTPGNGFSGVRIAFPAFTYDGQEWNIAGVNNDALQVGIRASDGKFIAGGGNVEIDEEGIFIKNSLSSWFNFEDAQGNRGTINIAADPNNDLEFVNYSTDGTMSFFLGNLADPLKILNMNLHEFWIALRSAAGVDSYALVIKEDPAVPNKTYAAFSPIGGNGTRVVLEGGAGDAVIDFRTQGSSGGSTFMRMRETTVTPPDPNTPDAFHMYIKSDKLIIQFADGGTTRYKYLDLTGTGVTWVHTTTAP